MFVCLICGSISVANKTIFGMVLILIPSIAIKHVL